MPKMVFYEVVRGEISEVRRNKFNIKCQTKPVETFILNTPKCV